MRAVGGFLSYGMGQIDPLTCESQVTLFCLLEKPDRGKTLPTLTVIVAASKAAHVGAVRFLRTLIAPLHIF